MSKSIETSFPDKKSRARKLRALGSTQKEIANMLNISQSTSSLWTSSVQISNSGVKRLENLRYVAREKAVLATKKKIKAELSALKIEAQSLFTTMKKDRHFFQLICAMLYWAEGGKTGSSVSFINSDPKMIIVFLHSLRKGFNVSESKFRGMVHLHPYHDKEDILSFWSRVSNIPLRQFSKSYLKPNAWPRRRPNYMGSFRVRYYDTRVAKQLKSIYTTLPDFI